MSPDLKSESQKWWQTLPGLLTAAAGIITAFTGLLLAAHQIGCFQRSPASQVRSHPIEDGTPSTEAERETAHPATASTRSRQITLPPDSEMRMDESVFKLVSARLEPYAPGKLSIRLSIRMTNNGRFAANFWTASFRLLADGALQAPTNDLDEIVASHSSKEGDIDFVIPANVSTVGVQMGDVGEGKPILTLNLQESRP